MLRFAMRLCNRYNAARTILMNIFDQQIAQILQIKNKNGSHQ
jgi:hypothetical protein